MLSPWLLLGFGWLGVCVLLAVFGLGRGIGNSLTWVVFGVALMAFHLQMHSETTNMDSGLGKMVWVIMLFSFLGCVASWGYALKRSWNSN